MTLRTVLTERGEEKEAGLRISFRWDYFAVLYSLFPGEG
jgi:hypothetical protein